MTQLKLQTAEKQQIPLIKKLYKRAFPRAERKPFGMMLRKQKQGSMEILALDDGKFAGLCITVLDKDIVLLDYFAIEEVKRDRGYGKETLDILRERYKGKRLFLEIEAPLVGSEANEEKVRRKNFYLRSGLSETGIAVKLFGVKMELLCDDCQVSFEEYYDVYRSVIGDFLAQKNVKRV